MLEEYESLGRNPEDILLDLEEQAVEEFEANEDRPDYVRTGRNVYVSNRVRFLIAKQRYISHD